MESSPTVFVSCSVIDALGAVHFLLGNIFSIFIADVPEDLAKATILVHTMG